MNATARQEIVSPRITIERFEAGDIDPDQFDHEAHVYVGWLCVCAYELTDAIVKFETGLKRLVSKFGVEGKYHATLTWFFMLLIADRAEPDEPWHIFKRRNADLVSGGKELLSLYYSEAHLFSERAREHFVLPDRLASN